MLVDQKHITTVRLNESRGSELVLQKDSRGFRLTIVSNDDVLHVIMGPQHLHQLSQELLKLSVRHHNGTRPAGQESLRTGIQDHLTGRPESRTHVLSAEAHSFEW